MELKTKDYRHFTAGNYEFTEANKALPGDLVELIDGRCLPVKRNKHVLVGTLELNSKTKYGINAKGYPIYLFLPVLRNYPPFIVGSSHKDTSKNVMALINFDSWTDVLPRGSLVRIIGPCDSLAVQEEALMLTYNPYKMPKNIEIELETNTFIGRPPCPENTFNIDPEGCVDIDDVISLTNNELWITIADVDERVSSGSHADNYAALQGQTVYKNGKAIQPMLPYELSENRCSLQPGVLRPGISLVLTFDPLTNVIYRMEWKTTCVFNKKAYDYDTFKEIGKRDGINIEVLQILAEGILGEKTDDPHKWIEAFMLKYNLEAARILRINEEGILRKHSGVDEEKWKTYIALNKDLGFLASSAALYCKGNDPNPIHVGIGSVYCHASSPIRRYADLVNQRIIKDAITGCGIYTIPDIEWLNKRQKDIKRYERDSFFLQNLGKGKIHAIVLGKKIWVEEWKRLVSWKNDLEPGTRVTLDYFVNPNVRHWKERIVYRQVV